MSTDNTSLLRQPVQGELTDLELQSVVIDRIDTSRNPKFTAADFFSRDPKRYRAVVKLSAAYGSHDIAEMLGVSVHTVLAVQAREPLAVAHNKAILAERCLTGARLAAEEILSRLADPVERAKIPANVLGPWVGILVEKHELLTGGVTARIGYEQPDDADAYDRFLSTLKRVTGSSRESARTKEREPVALLAAVTDRGSNQDAPSSAEDR
jgi:hypothetical protein